MRNYIKCKSLFTEKGFSLAELMLATAISGIVMTSIYSTYYSQQKSYIKQENVLRMQQNLRAAMFFMEREIRMAGCDVSGVAGAGIVVKNANSLRFTMNITDNAGTGDPDEDTADANEDVSYSLSGGNLVRNDANSGLGNQNIAENIDALNFIYLDESGAITATAADVRSIQVTLVAQTGKDDLGFTNTTSYYNQQGGAPIFGPANDKRHRRRMTAEIYARNLSF